MFGHKADRVWFRSWFLEGRKELGGVRPKDGKGHIGKLNKEISVNAIPVIERIVAIGPRL